SSAPSSPGCKPNIGAPRTKQATRRPRNIKVPDNGGDRRRIPRDRRRLVVTCAGHARDRGSPARHVADDISGGDGATQREERTRSHGRECSSGELDSLLPHFRWNLGNAIRRMDDGVRSVIYGNMQGVAYLADAGKRLVGEDVHDVVRRL